MSPANFTLNVVHQRARRKSSSDQRHHLLLLALLDFVRGRLRRCREDLELSKVRKSDHRPASHARRRDGKRRQDFRFAESTQGERIPAHGDNWLYQPTQYPAPSLAASSSDLERAPGKT